jgi:hypothetical protein
MDWSCRRQGKLNTEQDPAPGEAGDSPVQMERTALVTSQLLLGKIHLVLSPFDGSLSHIYPHLKMQKAGIVSHERQCF